jgi:predicted ribosome quality control (RQC) complex YloA/Tae2 family protein
VVVRSPGAPAAAPVEDGHLQSLGREELLTSGTAALDAHRRVRRQQLERLLQQRLKRLAKKRAAILEDLRRATTADALHERASLILAHLSEIPANASFFETESWEAEPQPIRIELEPPKSPIETAQQLFKKAKRLKRGLDVAPLRLDSVEDEIAELQRLQDELTDFSTDELGARLEALGVSTTAPKERERRRRQAGARLPYREFRSGNESVVLVGRGAADNDRLTLRFARPHDLWLHARGVRGAHVVVPLSKGQSCSAETLVDAATLAAHFSDLRGEAIVDVLYTPRRFVHKRRGSPVGSVTLGREKVIAVRIQAERLGRLLENERKQPT